LQIEFHGVPRRMRKNSMPDRQGGGLVRCVPPRHNGRNQDRPLLRAYSSITNGVLWASGLANMMNALGR
jgi:hypothetical protein